MSILVQDQRSVRQYTVSFFLFTLSFRLPFCPGVSLVEPAGTRIVVCFAATTLDIRLEDTRTIIHQLVTGDLSMSSNVVLHFFWTAYANYGKDTW